VSLASLPAKTPGTLSPVAPAGARPLAAPARSVDIPPLRCRTMVAVPFACAIALGLHFVVRRNDPEPDTTSYVVFLGSVLGGSLILALIQLWSSSLRRWLEHMLPIVAGGVGFLAFWDGITSGLRLLPLPYFPSPASVLRNLLLDWELILDSTWHSLLLLISGYLLGAVVGIVTGICIGWFKQARYWGMPLLKVIGPIPATAWIPLAMVISPKPIFSAVGLIALAVWFPVTMLTMSGIANTRASYLDVARTLGASPSFLIFRVAIPAAMPNIFLGLFMGLGASFLTLIVAETVGVRSGLGWYVSWAQGWAEYAKVYAALVIMAAFFSTIMTLLFKLRDRVLVWQKGTIKW
jgi:NitT/TauT family transport system permease protein